MTTISEVSRTRSNRKATKADAVKLAGFYSDLAKTDKALKSLIRTAKESIGQGDTPDLDTITASFKDHLESLVKARSGIAGLPGNTRAEGGATRQSVVMQFLGAVNRDLGPRLTPSTARTLNRASFGN